MPDNMQRSEATESKRKQGYASESMGKQWRPRESTRELRSLALLARFARPPTITTRKNCQKTGQNYQKNSKAPAKASKGLQSPGKARKDWERPGKARKSKKMPGRTNKAQQSPETTLKRPWSVQRAPLERPKGTQSLQNPPKTLPKPSQDSPQTLPRPSPNPP